MQRSNHFVPAENVKGRAERVYWSWVVASGPQPVRAFLIDLGYTFYRAVTFQIEKIRWGRIGRSLEGVADSCDSKTALIDAARALR